MPEGDTVFLSAQRLNQTLGGRVLTKTDFRVPRYATLDLRGKRVLEVTSRGKHTLMRLDGGVTLHTHFNMQGSWHIYRPGARWRSPAHHARIVLETEDAVVVGFRLPAIDVVDTDRETELVGHLGPDPLGDDWDRDEALARMRERGDAAIGEVLLDQRVIAGLGNVYKSEICFLAGVDPWTPVDDVPDVERVVQLAERLMRANRVTGKQITTGDTRPGRGRWVYDRKGDPCRRCHTPIEKRTQGEPPRERVTYWCPACQPDRSL